MPIRDLVGQFQEQKKKGKNKQTKQNLVKSMKLLQVCNYVHNEENGYWQGSANFNNVS